MFRSLKANFHPSSIKHLHASAQHITLPRRATSVLQLPVLLSQGTLSEKYGIERSYLDVVTWSHFALLRTLYVSFHVLRTSSHSFAQSA